MRSIYTCIAIFISLNTLYAQSITIAAARAQAIGSTVTVRGIATNGAELGKIRYIQDGTAGIAAFPGNGSIGGFDATVKRGDSIEVTGVLLSFQNLLEISPITAYTVISSNNPLPAPKQATLAELQPELESQLLRFECTQIGTGGGVFSSSGTYALNDSEGGQGDLYLRGGHPLLGSNISAAPVQLTGILSRFVNFQILPRDQQDLVVVPCFYFKEAIEQQAIATNSFELVWTTNLPASSFLRIGTQYNQWTQTLPANTNNLVHSIALNNLLPGSIYWAQAVSVHANDTIWSEVRSYATQSQSSGEIRVYFNHTVDAATAGNIPLAGQSPNDCVAAILERIEAAQQHIDVAMYNINMDVFVQALKAAHNRGVRVRYIAASATANLALDPAPPFPVLYGNELALMHHKLMIIDRESATNAWVLNGSLNWTEGNVYEDFNNILWIQDQSLARGYTIEFEEMWGSNGAFPDPANALFGSSKRNNTPHHYIIDGHLIESWCSPSDQVSAAIERVLRSAQTELQFALMTFTYDPFGDALANLYNQYNVAVEGILENENENGSEYEYLSSFGMPVLIHSLDGVLHHKYAVIDASTPESDPVVVTGSHNWSQVAESQNDEHTLIIHHPDIARLYQAEFIQRRRELSLSANTPAYTDLYVWPNPATETLSFGGSTVSALRAVEIWHSSGWLALSRTAVPLSGNVSVAELPAGIYFVKIFTLDGFRCFPVQKISR